jgi:hypothetical protein
MGPSSGSIMIVRLKFFELPNMDQYLVQHIHIIEVMPKLKCKNYNINLIEILRVYKEFVYKILASNIYRRWMICCKDIIKNKALRIKLKVIQLKINNIKIIRTIIKIMEHNVNNFSCSVRSFSVAWIDRVKPCCWASHSGSYFAWGCAVVNVFMEYYYYGLFGVLILHTVYVLDISRKIFISFMYGRCVYSLGVQITLVIWS